MHEDWSALFPEPTEDRPLRLRLPLLRRRRRFRQAEVARALDISQAAYSKWEAVGEDRFLARTVAVVEALGGRVEMHAVFDGLERGRSTVQVTSLTRSRWPAALLEQLETEQRARERPLRWYDPHEHDPAPFTDDDLLGR